MSSETQLRKVHPTKWLTVNVAPLTGGATVTTDEDLRKSYGMVRRKDYKDTEAYPDELGEYYRSARFQFGAQVTVDVKLKVNNNFSRWMDNYINSACENILRVSQ